MAALLNTRSLSAGPIRRSPRGSVRTPRLRRSAGHSRLASRCSSPQISLFGHRRACPLGSLGTSRPLIVHSTRNPWQPLLWPTSTSHGADHRTKTFAESKIFCRLNRNHRARRRSWHRRGTCQHVIGQWEHDRSQRQTTAMVCNPG